MKIEEYRRLTKQGDLQRNSHLHDFPSVHLVKDLIFQEGNGKSLDLYWPGKCLKKFPLVILIHGGGWVYGDKEINRFYAQAVADKGFAVAAIDYSLAPENLFPSALKDLDDALLFLKTSQSQFPFDFSKIAFLADSAGANIAVQYQTLAHAKVLPLLFSGFSFSIRPNVMVLNCGAYFPSNTNWPPLINDLYSTYLRPHEHSEQASLSKEMITADFPYCFLVSANEDFLLPSTLEFQEVLKERGIPHQFLLYSNPKHPIYHDFQLDYSTQDGSKCLKDETHFLASFPNKTQEN